MEFINGAAFANKIYRLQKERNYFEKGLFFLWKKNNIG
jgi:hypothetical protein